MMATMIPKKISDPTTAPMTAPPDTAQSSDESMHLSLQHCSNSPQSELELQEH